MSCWRRLLAAGLALTLAACAARLPNTAAPDATAPQAGNPWLTESDEPAARKRARLHLALALAYYEQDQASVALDEIKRGLLLDPTLGSLYNLRGLVFQRLAEPALGEASLRQALALNPQDPDALHNLAWMLCLQSRHDDAQALFARALAWPGAPAKTWMAQGLCQKQAGQLPAAEQSLQRALDLAPGQALVRYQLAQLMYQRRDWLGARAHLAVLNVGPAANAQTLWLAIRVERKLDNAPLVLELAGMLRTRFGPSPEALAYEKGLFHD